MPCRAGERENNSIAEPNLFPENPSSVPSSVILTGYQDPPKNDPAVHFTWLFRLLGWFFGEGLLMNRGPYRPASRAPSSPEEPTLTAQVQALLDHIRALDKSMDDARVNKLASIKKALADGTYHVSAGN